MSAMIRLILKVDTFNVHGELLIRNLALGAHLLVLKLKIDVVATGIALANNHVHTSPFMARLDSS